MKKYFTPEQISDALFHTDPMNTCCKENDCFDEYDRIARGVSSQLLEGFNLKEALVLELVEWLFETEGVTPDSLDPVVEYLNKEEGL